jgi:hypothetical protein
VSKRNRSFSKKIEKRRSGPLIKKKRTIDDLVVNKSVGIAVLPTMYGDGGVRLASQAYEITQPDGLVVVVNVSFETHSRISNLLTLLHGTTRDHKLFTKAALTWPRHWYYLTGEQLQYVEQMGILVISQSQRLMDCLQIASFPKWLYYGKSVDEFFDSWLEVIWQEYIIENELLRYKALPEHAKSDKLPTHQNIVEYQRAEAWIILENCAVRIRSIWDRIHKYLIPLYFTGELPTDDNNYWRDLDKHIRSLLANKPELSFYDHIFNFILNDILGKGTTPRPLLKELRDNLIHNLSNRPQGVVPPKSVTDSSFPKTPDEFYQLILKEHDRTRELLVIIVVLMRAKSPPNPELPSAGMKGEGI